jgi:hypothetical protein
VGEAKRQRTLKALRKGMEEIRAEGQGVWQLGIYSMEGAFEIAAAALEGNDDAGRILLTLERLLLSVQEAATTTDPALCLLCDNVFRDGRLPAAWVLLQAHRADPTHAVGNGICMDCWSKYPSVKELAPVVTDVYRHRVMPDLRVLPSISEPGRA